MTAAASAHGEPRRYRFPPLVRAGLFGAMPPGQVATLIVGGGVAFVSVLTRLFLVAPVMLAITGALAFRRVGRVPMYEWLTLRLSWWRRRRDRRWFHPVPLLGVNEHAPIALPPAMLGLELLEVDMTWAHARGRLAGVGVIHDHATGLVSAVLRVHGDGQFSLNAAADQDQRVGLWGDALAGFCREQSPVVQVTWQEWATTTPLAGASPAPVTSRGAEYQARADYAELLERAAPAGVTHEVLVTVSVDISRVRTRRRNTGRAVPSALEALSDELRLFTGRLEAAGLRVDPPHSPVEITSAVHARSHHHPRSPLGPGLGRSLGAMVGVSTGDLAPMAVDESFTHLRVDGSIHRAYWVEGWPRLDVPAAWMDLLLVGVEGTRTVTVVFEPVPPSAAARAIDEAAVALEASESAKAKHGFRIRATDRRKREEVEQRERELVAGYGDLAYAGFVHVTARDADTLDDLAADIEQTAAHVGVALRPLEGRHGAGWVASLPLGRTVATRRKGTS